MRYECFVEKRFNSASKNLIDKINDILLNYQSMGYKLSLRQLYYQLVAANVIPNVERSYKNLSGLVTDARLAGLVAWDIIEDRGRVEVANAHWNTPADILDSAAASYRVDMWENQPNFVMVMVEKQALEGVLIPVCKKMDVPFMANKGYSSASAMYDLAQRFREIMNGQRTIHILYLGDHDPSGMDMSRDIEDRLRLLSRFDAYADINDYNEPLFEVHRIALNMPQIRVLNPPENPAKITDSRFAAYQREFGASSWELDAIEPRRLARLVEENIERFISEDQWERDMERHKRDCDALKLMARNYRENQ